jgi:hypothetical protein
MAQLKPYHAVHTDVYFWTYVSSYASIAIAALLGIISMVHTRQTYKTRARFTIPFLLGCYCEFRFFQLAGQPNASDTTLPLTQSLKHGNRLRLARSLPQRHR